MDTQVTEAARGATTRFRIAIGNDVVDLRHPRCSERPDPDPLLRRILAGGEREWLEEGGEAAQRPVRLWALWAAKEATFKVHTQAAFAPGATFRPSRLLCELRIELPTAPPERALVVHGRVRLEGHPDGDVEVKGTATPGCVHVVGWSATDPERRRGRLEFGVERSDEAAVRAPDPANAAERLAPFRTHFTDAEWEAIRNPSSATVRLLARSRLEQLLGGRGAGPVEILTPTGTGPRRPPRVWAGGSEVPDVGVSLSHHGRFLAWAILLDTESR